jgi:phospholipase B1
MASNLPHEARDYLVPLTKLRGIPSKAFKYLNLQIGSNDQCALCTQAALGFGPGSADDFESSIRQTLEIIRAGIRT